MPRPGNTQVPFKVVDGLPPLIPSSQRERFYDWNLFRLDVQRVNAGKWVELDPDAMGVHRAYLIRALKKLGLQPYERNKKVYACCPTPTSGAPESSRSSTETLLKRRWT